MKEQLYSPCGRWLVVDDDPAVLALTCAVVTHVTGVEPEAFATGVEAIATVEAAPENVEVVITDMDMPGMTGPELCRRLRRLRPSLPVMLTTGSGFINQSAALGLGFCALLKKPFYIRELADALARVTSKSSSNLENAIVAEGNEQTTN